MNDDRGLDITETQQDSADAEHFDTGLLLAQADIGSGQGDGLPGEPTPPEISEVVPDGDNRVRLAETASIEDIRLDGDDLLLVQADGSQIRVVGGALNVPTFLIGEIEIAREVLVSALDSNGLNVAAGPGNTFLVSSREPAGSGGDFGESSGASISDDQGPVLALLGNSPDGNDEPPAAGETIIDDGQNADGTGADPVVPDNVDPTGTDKTVTIAEDTSRAFSASDFGFADVDAGDSLAAVRIDTLPGAGSLKLNGTDVQAGDAIAVADLGNLVFTPAADANGAAYAGFTFSVQDSAGAFDPSPNTISIDVTPVNDAPVAIDDVFSGDEDAEITGNVLTGNGVDTDIDGDSLSVVAGTFATAEGGSVTIDADGGFTYIPVANFNGADSFTYTLTDGTLTDTGTVNLSVGAQDDPPVAVADSFTVAEDSGATVLDVLANDTDVDAGPKLIQSVSQPANGTVVIGNGGADLSFTPDADFNTDDAADQSFTYTLNDGSTATVTVTVTPVNDAPVAADDIFAGNEDAQIAGNVLADNGAGADADIDGDALSVSLATDVSNGTLVLNANGSFTYTPDPDFNGADSFTYTVNDGTVDGTTATVTLTVGAVNDAPEGADATITIDEDGAYGFAAQDFGFSDPDAGDSLAAVRIDTLPGAGTLQLNGIAVTAGQVIGVADLGNLVFTPAANANGAAYAGFTFSVQDSAGTFDPAPNTISIDVTPVNDAPVAADDIFAGNEDAQIAGNVLADNGAGADADIDGDALTVSLASDVSNGTLVLNANGSFTYTPDPDFNGADSFTYTVNDGTVDGTTATVTLTVGAVNDAPETAAAAGNGLEDDASITVALSGSDPDGSVASFRILSLPANGTLYSDAALNNPIAASGTVAATGNAASVYFVPDADYNGTPSFTFAAIDDLGLQDSSPATAIITVTPVDDAPVAVADSFTVAEDSGATVLDVLANDTDVDAGPKLIQSVTQPANGTVVITNGGADLSFTPDADFNTEGAADQSFTYTLNDGSTATVTVTVTPVNDAPVAVDDTFAGNEDAQIAGNVLADNGSGPDADIDGDALTVSLASDVSNGTLVLNANGSFTYTPDADFNGADSFTYTVNDGTVDGTTATVTLTVGAVNDAPVANADSYSTTEDTPLTIPAPGVLLNDTDVDGDPLTSAIVTGPANGSLTLNADGSFTYTPDANFSGADSFTYTVNDGTVDGNTATVTLTVGAVNDAPETGAAAGNGLEDDASIAVALSGSDPDGSVASFRILGLPANGTLYSDAALTSQVAVNDAVVATGNVASVYFVPDADYSGTPSFTYAAIDDLGQQDATPATATINVTPVDDAPVAVADSFTVAEDSGATVLDVLANDTDIDAGPKLIQSVTQPANGTVVITNGGLDLSFTPDADFNTEGAADQSFTYTLNDGSTATVSVTVTPVNDAPVAVDDTFAGNEDAQIAGNVLADNGSGPDSDIDGDALTVSLASDVSNGTLVLNANGSFTYTPDPDFNGADGFSYTVNDGTVDGTTTATVTLNVGAVNDAPQTNAAVGNGAEDAASIAVALSGSDPDGSVASFRILGLPANGTLYSDAALSNPIAASDTVAATGNAASVYFVPDADYSGTPSFTFAAIDDLGQQDATPATATINVTPVDDAPVAVADSFTVTEDSGATTLDVLANDTDVDAGPKLIQSVTQPTNGTVVITNGGADLSFTPDADFNTEGAADQSFTYTLNDGSTATVTVTVTPVNDAPVAVDDTFAGNEDAQIAGNVLADNGSGPDADIDGDALTVSLASDVSNGTLVLNANGSFTYTPDADFNGADSFSYTVNDGTVDGNTATVTLNVGAVNDAPVANADSYSTSEDTPLVIGGPGVLANDTDAENGPLTAALVTGPSNGSLALNPDGSFTYTPDANFNGQDSFTYKTNDGTVDGNTETVTINVNPVNDAPVTSAIDAGTVSEDDAVRTIDLLSGQSDVDGDTLSVTGISVVDDNNDPVVFTDNGDGTISIDPDQFGDALDNGQSRTVTVSYGVSDGTATIANTATLVVTGADDNTAPTTDEILAGGDEDTAVTVLLAGSDPDGNLDGFVLKTLPANGTLYLDAGFSNAASLNTPITGASPLTLYFKPDADWSGSTSFTYAAIDNESGEDASPATATITVTAVADAPVISVSGIGDPVPLSGDVIVNATTASFQQYSSVSAIDGGGYVVTWSSFDQDGDGWGIYAQRYASDGTPQGGETRVNATTTNSQLHSSVSAIDGGYVVTWTSFGQDGDGSGIYAQRYDSDGTPQGGETLVNTTTADDQLYSSVSAIDGGYVVTWTSRFQDGDGYGIYAQRYASDGTPQGGETLVNTTTADDQLYSSVSAIDGGYVVTWSSSGQDGDGWGIYAQRYASDGTPQGGETLVNTTTTNSQLYSSVSAIDGGYLVTWSSYGQDGNSWGIYAQRYASDGTPQGVEFRINADITGHQQFDGSFGGSGVTVTDDGVLVAVWDLDFGSGEIEHRRFELPSGTGGNEDTDIAIDLSVALSDTDGSETLSDVTISDVPAGVILSAGTNNNDGTWTLTQADLTGLTLRAPQDWNGSFDLRVSVTSTETSNGDAATTTESFTVTIDPVNDAPVTNADSYSTSEDTPLVIGGPGVLANDTDIENDQLTAALVTGPSNGSVTLNPDGSFTYTPDADFSGTDSFTYKTNDGTVDGNTETVTIDVNPVNDAPVTNDDSLATSEDTPLTIGANQLLANDTDVDGDILSIASFDATSANGGTVTLLGNGDIEYTPPANFYGQDSFTYTTNDGTEDGNTATVTIDVNPVNDAPVVSGIDAGTVSEDDAVRTIDLLSGQSDVDGDTLSATGISVLDDNNDPVAFTDNGDGTISIDPDQFGDALNDGDSRTVTVSYGVSDGTATIANTATLVVTGADDNTAPTTDDILAGGDEDTAVTVLLTGSDPDGNLDGFVLKSLPANGTLYLDAGLSNAASLDTPITGTSPLTLYFKPDADWSGTTDFTYVAHDGSGAEDATPATATIDVAPVADTPSLEIVGSAGGKLFFSATDGSNGFELWSYDGTNPPEMVHDINPGSGGSVAGRLGGLIEFGGKIYFSASDGSTGMELWSYDGVNAPAVAADINTGGGSSHAGRFGGLIEFGGRLYFSANDGAGGYELWSYDGANPPALVADINTGGDSHAGRNGGLIEFGGKLYFSASDGSTGMELWSYDGTNPPAVVADINTGGDSHAAVYGSLIEFGGKLFFSATDGVNGFELWSYDGASPPEMVHDIRSGGGSSGAGRYGGLTEFGGKLYFSASDGSNGYELWSYDGANPPTMVADINPGSGSSDAGFYGGLIEFGGKLYFSANDGSTGFELWSYDGANSPMIVADINPGSAGSEAGRYGGLFEFGGKLYFSANDGSTGFELWSYDGVNPPAMVADIIPGSGGSEAGRGAGQIQSSTAFAALNGGLSGDEDTVIDVDVTAQLADTDGSESFVLVLTGFPAGAIFSAGALDADTGSPTFGGWVITQAQFASLGGSPLTVTPLPNWNGTFTLSVEMTVTDSATLSTGAVTDTTSTITTVDITVNPVNDAPVTSAIDAGTVSEDDAVQTIDLLSGQSDVDGDTLSVTGISVVDDNNDPVVFTDNGDGTISIDPDQFGDALDNGQSRTVTVSYGVSDGAATIANTATLVVTGADDNTAPTTDDILAGGDEDTAVTVSLTGRDTDGNLDGFVLKSLPANGTLYLDAGLTNAASANVLIAGASPLTLYFKPDADWSGTTDFTYVAHDSAGSEDTSPATATIDVAPVADTPVLEIVGSGAGKLFFSATNGSNGFELWSYDGANPPEMVADINPGSVSSGAGYFSSLIEFDGKLYFSATNGSNGFELWSYDGTNPPMMVADINPGGDSSAGLYSSLIEFGGKLYFSASDGSTGLELWSYDGTNPPMIVADINPGSSGSGAGLYGSLIEFGGKLYFSASDGSTGLELWSYDGVNSPMMVADINPGSGSSDAGFWGGLIEFGGKLYFSATEGSNGPELWSYDGVNAPVMVADINPGSDGSGAGLYGNLIEFGGKLYFSAYGGSNGLELWSYDGASPPTMVADINPGSGSSDAGFYGGLIEFGGKLYFSATDGTSGYELWSYDGANPPAMVADINPGVAGSEAGRYGGLFEFGGKLYFSATDGTSGYELWSYDGVNPPAMVADINPGSADSDAGASGHAWPGTAFAALGGGVSGDEDTAIEVPVTAQLADTDGSESFVLVLTGFPTGAIFNAGAIDEASGSPTFGAWVITQAQFASLGGSPLTVTPLPNWNGTFTLSVEMTVTDSATLSTGAVTDTTSTTTTVDITVNPVNDAPVTNADSYATSEDTPLTVASVLFNDTDTENDQLTAALVTGPSNGSVTLNPDGSFTYTPDANFSGTDSFTYKTNDGTADGNTETVTIDVNPVNDAPVTNADSYSTSEDAPLVIGGPGVLANDTDAENDPLTAAIVTGPANGSLALNADGSFTYTPDANFNGQDSFTYKTNDGTVDGNTATVTINVNPVNDAPVTSAINAGTVSEDDAVQTIDLLAGQTDVDGDTLSVTGISVVDDNNDPVAFTDNGDGTISIDPDQFGDALDNGQSRTLTVSYGVSDGTVTIANTATLVVSGADDNSAPTTDDILASGDEDAVVTLSLTGSDPDGNLDGFVLKSLPANGTLYLDAALSNAASLDTPITGTSPLTLYFKPDADWSGSTGFTYVAHDDTGTEDATPATVTIDVAPVADTPVLEIVGSAGGKLYFNATNGSNGFELWSYDGANPPAMVADINQGSGNSLAGRLGGLIEFGGKLYFSAYDSSNGLELWTYDGTNPPALVADINPGSGGSNAGLWGSLIEFDGKLYFSAEDGSSGFELWSYDGTNSPTMVADINPGGDSEAGGFGGLIEFGGKLYFSADDGSNGMELWSYDGTNPPTMVANINPGSSHSRAGQYGDLIEFGGKLYFNATNGSNGFELWSYDGANPPAMVADINPGSGSSSASLFGSPVEFNGKLYFSAWDGTNGIELWSYDGTNPPEMVADINPDSGSSYAGYHGGLIEFGGKLYFSATDGTNGYELWSYDGTNAPTMVADINPGGDSDAGRYGGLFEFGGKLYFSATDGTRGYELWSYDGVNLPAIVADIIPGSGSSDAGNGGGNFRSGTAFAALSDGVSGDEDTAIALDVTAALTDDSESFELVLTGFPAGAIFNVGALDVDSGSPNFGAWVISQAEFEALSGSPLTVTPPQDWNGTFTLSVEMTVTDSATLSTGPVSDTTSVTKTIDVTVTPVNDAPVTNPDSYSTDEDTTLVITVGGVLANDTDADSDPLTAALVTGPGNGTLSLYAGGTIIYTPNANFSGTDTFTYKTRDGTVDGNTATVTINVAPVNDAPITNPDSYSTDEDTLLTIAANGVLANDTDIDGDPLTAALVSGPSNGTLSLNADGSFTYTPNANFSGTDSFTYTANDGTEDGNTATVTINVNPVNDAPVAVDDSFTVDENSGATSINVLGNDTDVDGGTKTITGVAQPANGTIVITGGGSGLTYQPDPNFNGDDTFTYTLAGGSTATVTVTVTPENDAPVAVDDAVGGDGTTAVQDNFADAAQKFGGFGDGTTQYYAQTFVAGGTSLSSVTMKVEEPAAGSSGEDNVEFRILVVSLDQAAIGAASPAFEIVSLLYESSTQIVTVGDSGVVTVDTSGLQLEEGLTYAVVLDAFVAADSNSSIAFISADRTSATSTPGLFFFLNADENTTRADHFNATWDGYVSDYVDLALQLDFTSPPPATDEDTQIVIDGADLLANDTDEEGDPLTITALTDEDGNAGNGITTTLGATVTLNGDGTIGYDPTGSATLLALNDGETAVDTFTYTVSDGNGGTDTATVSVTVNGVGEPNVAPVISNLAASVTFLENTVNAAPQIIDSNVSVTDFDSLDFNGGTLTIAYASGGGAEDQLSFLHDSDAPGQIGVAGNAVKFGGAEFGTFTGGTNGSSLVVTFNSVPSPSVVEMLIERLAYSNTSDTPVAARTLTIELTDGDGGSTSQTVEVNVTPEAEAEPVFQLSSLLSANGGDGSAGFAIDGVAAEDNSGYSVSGIGDMNGDGIDDFAILSRRGTTGSSELQAYVVFGKTGGFDPDIDLAGLNGTDGFRFTAPKTDTADPYSDIASAGDFNGDGLTDFAIGVAGSNAVHVLFGTAQGFSADYTPTMLNGTNGFTIQSTYDSDFGVAMSFGDTNGDGYDDLVVVERVIEIPAESGDPFDLSDYYAWVHTFFGKTDGFDAVMAPGDLASAKVESPAWFEKIVASVSAAGDINGDGYDDVYMGARASGAYAVFGSASGPASVSVAAGLNGTAGFFQSENGPVVSIVGDINGDGYDDQILTDVVSNTTNVMLGHAGPYHPYINHADFTIAREQDITVPIRVSGAGDVNGDGYDDMIIGYGDGDPNGVADSGQSYVIFGRASGFGTVLDPKAVDGTDGFVINGIAAGDKAGTDVAAAGDVNGDGFDDLIVGAAFADPNGNASGQTYILFGGAFGQDATPVTTTGTSGAEILIGGIGGDILTGNGGADVIRAGAGDDNLHISDASFFKIDGGHGTDTLTLDGSGITLDLTQVANNKIESIERIDLTGSGDNTLGLSQTDVLTMSSDVSAGVHTLTVDGDAGDKVDFDTAIGWTKGSDVVSGATTYQSFSNGNARVLVADAVTVNIAQPVADIRWNGEPIADGQDLPETSDVLANLSVDTTGSTTYALESGSAAGFEVSAAGVVTLTGTLTQGQSYTLNISATNLGGSYSENFTIHVLGQVNWRFNSDFRDHSAFTDADDIVYFRGETTLDVPYDYAGGDDVYYARGDGSEDNVKVEDNRGDNFYFAGADRDTIGISSSRDFYGGDGDDNISAYGGIAYGEGGNDDIILYSSNEAFGGDGDDEIFATSANLDQVLHGGDGADRFYGNKGADTVYIDLADVTNRTDGWVSGHFHNIVGGRLDIVTGIPDNGGYDTLAFEEDNMSLDLTQIHNEVIVSFEKIDMSGAGDNTLTLTLQDLLDLSYDEDAGITTLTVVGDDTDKVKLADFGNWTPEAGTNIDGIDYAVYTNGAGRLLVQDTISVTAPGDPIILDLDGDGLRFAAASFDINNDGHPDSIGWPGAGDGLLVADLDGSGMIEDGSEVFSPQFDGGGFATSIEALASWDSNEDGEISALDAGFGTIRVWVDANADGISDAGELQSLSGLGIVSIGLGITETDYSIDGQHVFAEGLFEMSDGSTRGYFGLDLGPAETSESRMVTGGEGDDILAAILGHDTLTGGAGADTFVFDETALGDAGVGIQDLIADYSAEEGDMIDLSALLDGAPVDAGNAADYVQVNGAFLEVDIDGSGGAAGFVEVAEFAVAPAADALRILVDHASDPATVWI